MNKHALLFFLRGVWLALTGLLLAIFVTGLPLRLNELNRICNDAPCPIQSLNALEARTLNEMGFALDHYGAFHVSLEILMATFMLTVAVIIFWARFDDWVDILVSFAIMLFGLNLMVEVDGAFVAQHPAWREPYELLTALSVALFVVLLYLFPDGRFSPRVTRYVAVLFVIAGVVDALAGDTIAASLPAGTFSAPMSMLYLACLSFGLGTQVYRFRNVSSPTERQQTKWVLFGIVMVVTCMILYTLVVELLPLESGRTRLLFNTVGFAIMLPVILLFPLSMMFSILRYRLWDIDLVINRTLVYAALTALLAATFLLSITLMQALFVRLTGQDSQAAIVLSTLLITVLFNPLRRSLQNLIDRRFYRRKYDAARVLDRFARTARDEVDLESLSNELLKTVQTAVQPDGAMLWLRKENAKRSGP